jgi:hypothetical protein
MDSQNEILRSLGRIEGRMDELQTALGTGLAFGTVAILA